MRDPSAPTNTSSSARSSAAPANPLGTLAMTWHGPLAFDAAEALNRADAAACTDGAPGRLRLFTPQAAVLTLGRRVHDVTAAGLTQTVAHCRDSDVAVVPVDRGGQATLHLPGQIVAFIALPCSRTAVAALVAQLLDGADAVAREHGLTPTRGAGVDAGLWLAGRKLASIGLRHQHGVVRHGLALNVAIDSTLSRTLVLCGHTGAGYADLTNGGPTVDLEGTAHSLIAAWGGRFVSDCA